MTDRQQHHAEERQSLLTAGASVLLAGRQRGGGASSAAAPSDSASSPSSSPQNSSRPSSYGGIATAASNCNDEEVASSAPPQQQPPTQFGRMPYGYHLSMTNQHVNASETRTADLGLGDAYDDDTDDSSNSSRSHIDDDDNDDDNEEHEIGYVGSYAIAINSLAGPAVLQLPFQYQQSGFVATTAALLGVAVVSVACSMYICRTVQAIPATAKVERPVELSTVVDFFWSRKAYLVTQWLFFACTFCLNVAAMIDTAQVVDTFLGVSGGSFVRTFGWTPFPTTDSGNDNDNDESSHYFHAWNHPKCTRKQVKLGHCDPFVYANTHEFSNGTRINVTEPLSGPILTLGYAITAAVFAPLCVMDLKENTNWQIGGCFLLLTLSAYFCFAFLQMDLVDDGAMTTPATQHHHNNLTLWGSEYRDLLGVILFNFALVLALPAWLHTKKRSVKVSNVVYGSTGISTLLYVAVGTIVAITIPHANQNMLAPMVSGAFGTGIQAASSLFCFFIIGLDIPLFCVLTRYNLSKLLPGRTFLVNALVVYIPWGLSWVLYQGDAIGTLLDWGGVLLTSAIAFLLPLYLAYRVLMYTDLPLFPELTWASFSPSVRRGQVRTVLAWLTVTAVAVAAAIFGQAAAQADKYEYCTRTST